MATIRLRLITDALSNIPIFTHVLRSVVRERRVWLILREVLIT